MERSKENYLRKLNTRERREKKKERGKKREERERGKREGGENFTEWK